MNQLEISEKNWIFEKRKTKVWEFFFSLGNVGGVIPWPDAFKVDTGISENVKRCFEGKKIQLNYNIFLIEMNQWKWCKDVFIYLIEKSGSQRVNNKL